jgi:hypothetical protein
MIESGCERACYRGCVDVLEWLSSLYEINVDDWNVKDLATSKSLMCVKLLYSQGIDIINMEGFVSQACRNGCLEVIEWVHSVDPHLLSNYDVIKYTLDPLNKYFKLTVGTYEFENHIKLLVWFSQHGWVLPEDEDEMPRTVAKYTRERELRAEYWKYWRRYKVNKWVTRTLAQYYRHDRPGGILAIRDAEKRAKKLRLSRKSLKLQNRHPLSRDDIKGLDE